MTAPEILFDVSLLGKPVIIRCPEELIHELLALLEQHSVKWVSGARLTDGTSVPKVDDDHCCWLRVTENLLASHGSGLCYSDQWYADCLRTYYDPLSTCSFDVEDLL